MICSIFKFNLFQSLCLNYFGIIIIIILEINRNAKRISQNTVAMEGSVRDRSRASPCQFASRDNQEFYNARRPPQSLSLHLPPSQPVAAALGLPSHDLRLRKLLPRAHWTCCRDRFRHGYMVCVVELRDGLCVHFRHNGQLQHHIRPGLRCDLQPKRHCQAVPENAIHSRHCVRTACRPRRLNFLRTRDSAA